MAKDAWERITRDQYNLWKNNPVTMAAREFYSDYADALAKEMLRRWLSKEIVLDDEKEAAGRIDAIHEIVELDYYTITSFYDIPNEAREESDAA